jgi:hypothetical protein
VLRRRQGCKINDVSPEERTTRGIIFSQHAHAHLLKHKRNANKVITATITLFKLIIFKRYKLYNGQSYNVAGTVAGEARNRIILVFLEIYGNTALRYGSVSSHVFNKIVV